MTEAAGDTSGKSPEAYRTIGEVSDMLGVAQHVLRFWESRFSQIKPVKRAGNRRYYRPDDIALIRRIRELLHEEGYSIRGVQKLLKTSGVKGVIEGADMPGRDGGPAAAPADNMTSFATCLANSGKFAICCGEIIRPQGVALRARRSTLRAVKREYPGRSARSCRSVAQSGSALVWGTRGRGFESRRSDQLKQEVRRNPGLLLSVFSPFRYRFRRQTVYL